MPSKLTFLITTLTLVACTPVAPPRPETVPPPRQWATPVAVSKPTTRTDWWKALGDPTLDRLVTDALRANTNIALAAARVLQARAQLAAADAATRPSLQIDLEVDQVRIPAFKLGGERQPPQHSTWPYAGFGFDYEFDILGRLARASRSAQGELAASELDREQTLKLVAFEVVRSYADWCLAERQLRNQEQRQAWAEALLAEEQRRLAAGLSTWRGVNEAERDAQTLRTDRVRLERDRDLARANLALLTARPLAHLPLVAQPDANLRFQDVAVEADLPASAIGRRGDVQAAWQRLEAATTDIERAQLERYPRVTLTGLIGIVGSGFSGWLARDALAWIAGVAASLPIYDGGRAQVQIDAATALRAERQALYRKTVYEALTEVETALIQWQSALGVLERERQQAELRHRDLDNETRALELGRASRPDILRLRLASAEAEAAVDVALHGRLQAYVGVQHALGR